jgi:hypothetical protein
VFHCYAIVDNQAIAQAMDMYERSQDPQRQDLEEALAAKVGQVRDAPDILAASIQPKENEIHLRWKLIRHVTFRI